MKPTAMLAATLLVAVNALALDEGGPFENQAMNRSTVMEQREASFVEGLNPALRIALGVLVPGLPQYLRGQRRAYAFFAAEAAGISGIVYYNVQAHNRRNNYYLMARKARNNFVLGGLRNNPTEVPDVLLGGYGEYYEDLTKWASSGDFDKDPSLVGIQPETDRRTYNGHQWHIAKINNYSGSHGGLPVAMSAEEEARALEAYLRAVYPLEYNWDWTGLDAKFTEYDRVFDSAEVSYRRRNSFTIVLIANHILSAVDMLIMEKINQAGSMRANNLNLGLQPRSSLTGGPETLAFELVLSRSF